MSLYGRLQGQLGPVSSSSADSAKVQAVQAKGASVLVGCWAKVINETTALLSGRRAAYLAQNGSALAALQSQVDGQVTSLQRRYGIKLALVRS
jgi:tartrate dehydratase beta subunit/fumarate hydratase class I family protein